MTKAQSSAARTGLAGIALAMAATSSASAREPSVAFDIPEEPVSRALADFGRQAGVQILAPTRGLEDRITPALVGRFEVIAALERLLANTPLRLVSHSSRVFVLKLAPPSSSARPSAEAPPASSLPVRKRPPVKQLPRLPVVGTGETIVVTGSRVIFSVNDNPSPITALPAGEMVELTPASLPEALALAPVFSGSRGPTSNPASTGTVGAGNAAANQLNLRNLGANRNLILFDGLRVPPTLTNGVVDVDMIPQRLVKRVDIVTGGVSAVYGSDAVTGAVNFIIDKQFRGIEATVRRGISAVGDDGLANASVAIGANFAGGSGHVEASYEYRDNAGIPYRSVRAWNNLWAVEGAGTADNPFTLLNNIRLPGTPFGGLITSGPLAGQTFNAAGALTALPHGAATGSPCCEIGGDGGYYDSSMKASLRSHQFFARADYDLGPAVHVHAQIAGNLKRNVSYSDPLVLNNVAMSTHNPFLPAGAAARMADAGLSTFTFSEMVAQGPRLGAVADSSQWMVTAGLEGRVAQTRWALAYTRGDTRLRTVLTGNVDNQRLAAALDAVVDPASGKIVCAATVGPVDLAPGCVPLNLFGPSSASPAALAYVFRDTPFVAQTHQDDVTGSVQGTPLRTPAGPVGMALSAEWRRLSYRADSAAELATQADCTGLRFNCLAPLQLWRETLPGSRPVSQSVAEAALELRVPLLANLSLARNLSVIGAGRFTHYNTSGSYLTWKLGIDWHVDSALRLRATRSRDIRAPTLSDLYSQRFRIVRSRPDLLTNTTVDAPTSNQGNANLQAEIGTTATLGLVWAPPAIAGLSLSLDAFRIKVADAITTVQGFAPAVQTACYASGGISPYCTLQDRPYGFADTSPANAVKVWRAMYINIAEIETWGADIEVSYRSRLFGRPMEARLLGAWQPHIRYRQPGLETVDQGGVAFGALGLTAAPSIRLTGMMTARPAAGLTVSIIERWRNPLKIDGAGLAWTSNRIAAFATTGINLAHDIALGRMAGTVQLNVQNLFDADPPGAAYSGYGSIPGSRGGWAEGDNPVGRYFTFSFTAKL